MAIRSRKPDDLETPEPVRQLGLFWSASAPPAPRPAVEPEPRPTAPAEATSAAPSIVGQVVAVAETVTVVVQARAGRDSRDPESRRTPTPPPEGQSRGGTTEVRSGAGTSPGTGEEPAPTAPRIYGVADLIRAARLTLESRFTDVRVEGEISGLRATGGGHLYFTLKDETAALDCVLFSREASKLKFRPQDGLAVRVRGRLTIFEGRGKFQMTVAAMEPTGAGALAFAFEQLKQRLAAEGLFEAGRKRPIPFMPRTLGVVTSPHGAVIRDIIRVAHRRFPIAVLLSPAPVQGPGSAAAVVMALQKLAARPEVDVIIVARGGGSLEDLWTFNEEVVARAIANCPKPVISAVGHETDFTIADFVADLRAPTPSAAAELAVPLCDDLRAELVVLDQRLRRGLRARAQAAHLKLEQLRRRLGSPRAAIDQRRQKIDDLAARLQRALLRRVAQSRQALAETELRLARQHPRRRIESQRGHLAQLLQRFMAAERRAHDRRRHGLENLRTRLAALSPLAVLERGYSLARLPDGRLLTDAEEAPQGTPIAVTLRRGTLDAAVIAVHPASPPDPSDLSVSRESHDPSRRPGK